MIEHLQVEKDIETQRRELLESVGAAPSTGEQELLASTIFAPDEYDVVTIVESFEGTGDACTTGHLAGYIEQEI